MPSFPWYDSWWLTRYVQARRVIARSHPSRLTVFEHAFEPLRTAPDFRAIVLDDVISESQANLIHAAVRAVSREQLELHELHSHGRFVVHDHPLLEGLHRDMADAVGERVGEDVEPSYSFLAFYKRHGRCDLHLDAPVSKWTLDYCIEQSRPWPILFSEVVPWPEEQEMMLDADWHDRLRRDRAAPPFDTVALHAGQSVLFSGSSQWHYRDPITNPRADDHWTLLFLHFLPAGMKEVAEWRNWESIFGIPGLTAELHSLTD